MVGEGKYDQVSAWWAFDMLQRLVDDYIIDRTYVREIWDCFEQREFKRQKEFEKVLLQVYDHAPALVKELLTENTYQSLCSAADIAKMLVSQYLRARRLVK